jgi:hypothetical protein
MIKKYYTFSYSQLIQQLRNIDSEKLEKELLDRIDAEGYKVVEKIHDEWICEPKERKES